MKDASFLGKSRHRAARCCRLAAAVAGPHRLDFDCRLSTSGHRLCRPGLITNAPTRRSDFSARMSASRASHYTARRSLSHPPCRCSNLRNCSPPPARLACRVARSSGTLSSSSPAPSSLALTPAAAAPPPPEARAPSASPALPPPWAVVGGSMLNSPGAAPRWRWPAVSTATARSAAASLSSLAKAKYLLSSCLPVWRFWGR